MKSKTYSITALTTLLLTGLWAVSQQAQNNPPARPAQPPTPNGSPIPYFGVDRKTWNVIDPFNRGIDLSAANTFEKRQQRWKTIFAGEYPQEYEKRFPKTPEQIAAERIAADGIEHPKTLDEYLKEPRTPEQQRALENALDAIQHPERAAARQN